MLFLGVSTASYFITKQAKLIVLAIFAVTLIVSAFMTLLAKISQKVKYFLTHAILCSLAIILATGISLSYFDVQQEKFEQIYDKEHTIEAVVLSKNYESEFYSRYKIAVTKVNGEEFDHDATLTCEYLSGADVGDIIIVKATATCPEDKSGAVFNEKISMLSDGMFVCYTSYDDVGIIITKYAGFHVRLLFAQLNDAVSGVITDRVDGEAGNLSSAILLGNKHLLANTTNRDFSRAGVSHILALSGMHMTIIMGAFTALLWMFTDNTKKIGIFASIAAVFYLALTGFSVSATRAVLMLLIVYLAMIIFNEPDPLTSLSIAGAVIIALMPGSIFDAGFWMSFMATFGLLVYMPPFHEYITDKLYSIFKGKSRRIIVKSIVYVLDLFTASLFALIPLVVVMCIFIKEMSWFSILSSAVLSLPSSALILFSLLLVCFFYVPYLSHALIFLIERTSEFMIEFCADISEVEGAVFSLNYPFITIAAIVIGLALFYSFASNHKRKLVSVIPFACSILLLIGTIGVYEGANSDNLKVTYVNASTVSDILVLSSENEVVICDMSNGSKSTYSKAIDEVYAARATEIRAIIMTGYSYSHASTYADLFGSEIVREIWVPYPENADEYYKMTKIHDVANRFGVKTYIYHDGDVLEAFDNTNIYIYQDRIDRSAVPVTLVSINTSRDRILYVSPAFNESKIHQTAEGLFAKSEYIIFGIKGPKVKNTFTVENNHRTEAIVFASKGLIAHFDTTKIKGVAYFYVDERIEFYLDE